MTHDNDLVSRAEVKPLVWEEYSADCHVWQAPLFGAILVKRHWKGHWVVVWSTPGYTEVFVPGPFDDLEGAKSAAESRIRSALTTEAGDKPRPLDEWHEDMGDCVWWCWQDGAWLGEPAMIGNPLDSAWPGYHTHFTPHPKMPAPPATEGDA